MTGMRKARVRGPCVVTGRLAAVKEAKVAQEAADPEKLAAAPAVLTAICLPDHQTPRERRAREAM